MVRMMNDRLYPDGGKVVTDNEGRIRMDDWEMQEVLLFAATMHWLLRDSGIMHLFILPPLATIGEIGDH